MQTEFICDVPFPSVISGQETQSTVMTKNNQEKIAADCGEAGEEYNRMPHLDNRKDKYDMYDAA